MPKKREGLVESPHAEQDKYPEASDYVKAMREKMKKEKKEEEKE